MIVQENYYMLIHTLWTHMLIIKLTYEKNWQILIILQERFQQ